MKACLIFFLLGFYPCSDTLTCHKGVMLKFSNNLAVTPTEWLSFETQKTNSEEMCQETLLLIDVGERSLLLGSKGPISARAQDSKSVSVYAGGPGVVAASYVLFCSSDLCNKANSSSVLLGSLPRQGPSSPGTIQCPICLQFHGACSRNSNFVFCPVSTQCYTGNIDIEGGGISARFNVDGCLALSTKFLIADSDTIGAFSVLESPSDEMISFSNIIPCAYLAWVLGLGLSLAICAEGFALSPDSISL